MTNLCCGVHLKKISVRCAEKNVSRGEMFSALFASPLFVQKWTKKKKAMCLAAQRCYDYYLLKTVT